MYTGSGDGTQSASLSSVIKRMKIVAFLLFLCVFHTLTSPGSSTEVSVLMRPSRSQFFQYEDVSLSCDSSAGVGRLRRNTTTGGTEWCSSRWGVLTGSSCTIHTLYPSDSGLYWCEFDTGGQSPVVRVTVTAGSVILGIPPLPVMEGDDATLRCTTKELSSDLRADFYKDGLLIRSNGTQIITVRRVSKSDEGFYKCSVAGAGDSAESWLSVRESEPAAPRVLSLHRLVCHVVVGAPYLMSTIILGLIYKDGRRALQLVAEDRRDDVVTEV